ncbi:hypothetical protein FOWG_17232 [Fusarium oxysporum f. sp. lycopersici MN25]|nr:hypothetical protein FOWG_17232 [Fusarium oxysporum f. sp. lycopersici MN25]
MPRGELAHWNLSGVQEHEQIEERAELGRGVFNNGGEEVFLYHSDLRDRLILGVKKISSSTRPSCLFPSSTLVVYVIDHT